jgi:hypothetical protein
VKFVYLVVASIISLFLVSLVFASSFSKTYAAEICEFTSRPSYVCNIPVSLCDHRQYDYDCNDLSAGCKINPWCTKYTPNECASHTTDVPPGIFAPGSYCAERAAHFFGEPPEPIFPSCGDGLVGYYEVSFQICHSLADPTPTPAPSPTPKPCKLVATKQTCNSTGDGWIDSPGTQCVLPGQCSTEHNSVCQATCFSDLGDGLCVSASTSCDSLPGDYKALGGGPQFCSDPLTPTCCVPKGVCRSDSGEEGICTSAGKLCSSLGDWERKGDGINFCDDADKPQCCVPKSKAVVQGHFVDENDQFVSRNIENKNHVNVSRTIGVSGGGLTTTVGPDTYGTSSDAYLWTKSVTTSLTKKYTVTAAPTLERYNVYYATCQKNTSCAPTFSSSKKAYSSQLPYYLDTADDIGEVDFKYVPLVMIQGHFVDESNKFVSANGRTITITGGGLGSSLWPSSAVYPPYDTTSDFLWKIDSIPASPNPYTVTASQQSGYDVWSAVCSAKNQSSCGNPRSYQKTSSVPLGGSLLLNIVDDWTDIYFKYVSNGSSLTPSSTPPGGGTPIPTATPIPTVAPGPYTISGKIFNDTNGDGKSTGDALYTGAITITSKNGNMDYTVTNTGGNYTTDISGVKNLPAGQYTVTFSGLASGWRFTYPTTPGNSLIVTVGAGCSVPNPGNGEASCPVGTGNVINLTAGVTNSILPWIQSIGSDIRIDRGINITLPSASTYASVPPLSYAGGMPGVMFSGVSTPSLGGTDRKVSALNWQVGGSTKETREVFTDTRNLVPTSYRFLLETAESSGITPVDLITPTNYCGTGGIDNCTLSSTLPNGIYKSNGNLNLSSATYTFPAAKNFIILVNGALTINGKILVPIGSTAIFSVNGNITVNSAVGETTADTTCNITSPTHAGCSIEGLYSADNDFIVDGPHSCPTADKRLNIAGTAIANAGRTGGAFVNNRSLCGGNSTNPSVSFVERPDFMLNYPSMVKLTTRVWQDVAP